VDKAKVVASAAVSTPAAPAVIATPAGAWQSPAPQNVIARSEATWQSPAPATPQLETYKPFDLDAAVGSAEEAIRRDGQAVAPLSRAYYFYPAIVNFDLRVVPRQLRVSESKRLVDKGLELFTDGFKSYTKLAKPPTPAQAQNARGYMLQLKKDYEKANNLTCSDRTFDELKNILSYFNDLYAAQDGLTQLDGKTIDWSIYGDSFFGPTQVGWDYARML
jgi:hypothetical protein